MLGHPLDGPSKGVRTGDVGAIGTAIVPHAGSIVKRLSMALII